MAAINGAVDWGIVPYDYNGSQLSYMSWDFRFNILKSANDQLRYQIVWNYSNYTEGTEPHKYGDVVNAIFKVETSVDQVNWTTIGSIKKARDVANKRYDNGTSPLGHRFTVDVSQLVADQLSYSLCPINKGTWQSPFYGGMNGGIIMQDNVIGSTGGSGGYPVSDYNVSDNGTLRFLRVTAKFDMIGSSVNNYELELSSTTKSGLPIIALINSVNQFERDSVLYEKTFLHNDLGVSSSSPRRFNTNCPNWFYSDALNKVAYHKKVRMDEQAEFLQWYVSKIEDDASNTQFYNYSEIFGQTYAADGTPVNEFVMADFNSLLNNNSNVEFGKDQYRMLIQNVSPDYINNNAYVPQTGAGRPYLTSISPLTTGVHRYSLTFRGRYYNTPTSAYVTKTHSATNWYEIDREDENTPYPYVRFHWLNAMGGTDSYTAKRDIVEGLTISRDVVERKSADRTWYQDDRGYKSGAPNYFDVPDADYISDTMRGGNLYKGGREVSNVNAERVMNVYTEPLNESVAKWLEEMLLSPNVWIEKDTPATKRGNQANPYLRPTTKGYIPIIITNSDIETVNQSQGLVKFNIEYTLSHKVKTQRN